MNLVKRQRQAGLGGRLAFTASASARFHARPRGSGFFSLYFLLYQAVPAIAGRALAKILARLRAASIAHIYRTSFGHGSVE